MSFWVPKDLHIYSKFQKYKNKLLQGSRQHNTVRTMDVPPRSMITSMVVTKGLSNKAGENNCFLNSAVQILWHLDVFRKNFHLLSHHTCLENACIFCALKIIFTQFAFSEEKVLPPDALRKALAVAFANQQKFQIGLMDDAAECFEHILTRIHFHLSNGDVEDQCALPYCIPHQKFAMTLIEQVMCNCGETSEPLPFVQLVHYVTAHAIINLAQKGKATSFGHMLRLAHSDGSLRNQCPTNCGQQPHVKRTLTNVPDVVTIGLIWDSDEQSSDNVRNFLEAIGTELCLVELFDSVLDAEQSSVAMEHKLVGMVCYYGKHYSAFLLHSKSNCWKSCDDANVTDIGSKWSDVVEKCSRGRYQPLLLLYQNPKASAISTKSLPEKTTILTSAMPTDGKAAAPADAKQGTEKLGEASSKPSSSHGNCNINNSNVFALNGICFDQRPTVTPSAPPPVFSQSGTKPSVARPSDRLGRPLTKPSVPGVALSRPSTAPSGPSVALPRPSATRSGASNLQTRPSESPRPAQSGSSHSLPRSSDSLTKHPSSQMLTNSNQTVSYIGIPTLHQLLNPPLHQQQQLHTTNVTENAFNTLNSPGRSVIPINGNATYQGCYDVLPSQPAYMVYNGPLNHLPYQPGTVQPVMSSHGPSFSNNFSGLASVPNSSYGVQTQQPLAPPSGYGQVYYGGCTGVTVPSTGANLQVAPVPSTSVTNQLDNAGQDYSKAGNQSDVLVLNEGSLTNDVTQPKAPSSEMNLMDWSIITEDKTLPSPDSDSASSQYDNLLDFLSVDDKTSCQMMSSANGIPLVTRNESLTDSYFVVPDAKYLDDMANGKDLTKEADQLIEQSEAKEMSGDMHAALICCNQATNLYAMARRDPSRRTGNGDLELKEKRASSRSKRLLQQIEYNRMKSKSDAKNKFSATSGIPLQGCTSPTNTIDQDLLIFLEDPTKPYPTPQYQALKDNLPQLYGQNYGGSRYHWVSK